MLLKDLTPGQSGIVEQINLPPQMKRRLQALGMTDLAPVTVLERKGRGIMILRLRSSRFALGSNITGNIQVRCGA